MSPRPLVLAFPLFVAAAPVLAVACATGGSDLDSAPALPNEASSVTGLPGGDSASSFDGNTSSDAPSGDARDARAEEAAPPLLPHPASTVSLTVPASVGPVTSMTITFTALRLTPLAAQQACPVPSLATGATVFAYTEVVNSTGKDATVSLWHSEVVGVIDTIMAAYPGPTPPADGNEAARKACLAGNVCNDYCTIETNVTPVGCSGPAAALAAWDGHAVRIPKATSVTIYTSVRDTGISAGAAVRLSIRSETLN